MSLQTPTTLTEIEDLLDEKAVQDVRRAANILVQRQFLFAGDRGAAHAFETLTKARFRRFYESLFDGLGYQFIHSDTEQWVGLMPDPDLDVTPRMRLDDTIVLLVLAHIWQEEVQRGGSEARAVVVTTVNEAFERYRDLAGRHRKEALTTARLVDTLKGFARRSLVRIGPFDAEADDHELEIRPMVNRLVDGDALTRLERFAATAEGKVASAQQAASAEADPDPWSSDPADPEADADADEDTDTETTDTEATGTETAETKVAP